MFNLFGKTPEYTKVEVPRVEVPVVEQESQYYSIGPTTEGRVMLKLYYGNVSLNEVGIDSLIRVLEASKQWCEEKSGKEPEDIDPV